MDDREVRASALQTAAILSSGSLTLEDFINDRHSAVAFKAIAMSEYLFVEYIKYGTVNGSPLNKDQRSS